MEKLNQFDFKAGPSRYPEELLDGGIYQCFQKQDFECEPHSFAQTMYNFAKKNGKKMRCRVLPDGSVVVQAYVPGATS